MNVNVYSSKGIYKGVKTLPKYMVVDKSINLLTQAIRVYQDRKHFGFAKAKTRGEVNISTRKIYRQKGTGFARHGAKSAPIFIGGGVAHGPTGVKRKLILARKMRRGALAMAFSLKAKNKEVFIIDGISSFRKTKEASLLINKIIEKEKLHSKAKIIICLSERNRNLVNFFRNIKNVDVEFYRNLNAEKVISTQILLIDSECFTVTKNISKTKGILLPKKVQIKRSKDKNTHKSKKR
ncbi:50S ribosomal protein L4 [Candidatus Woesebacteria bacterium RBG_13_34_9]|uniref:Large ribosomal subunit protein uL4 n=1 Tax=Candidatus Woesebacteria bacterium RBG_13_34_9 TaxID=1802477 RepID=A0A1F7X3H5_9BACT|nr:MAG: 50S ribosomal protein L4 [Candidatus Woesebacteria bacterium RBG_13_34_9]